MSLASFLRLAEEVGETPLHVHTFVERVGASLLGDLLSNGLVARVGAHAQYHCGAHHGDGCPRRVVDDPEGNGLFLAMCGRSPPACRTIRLGDTDRDALLISRPAIEALVGELFRVTPKERKEGLPFQTLGEHRRRHGKMRDVAIAWQPSNRALTQELDRREAIGPRTLLLVPTMAELPHAAVLRYRTKRRVEIAALSEMLAFDRGRLILREPEPLPAGPSYGWRQKKKRTPKPAKVLTPQRLPTVKSWKEISLHYIDDFTLLLVVGEEKLRVTCLDLGMASQVTHEPTQLWDMLVRVCRQRGWFTGKGEDDGDKVRMVRFRDALQAAFGLSGDPFSRYAPRQGWRARFNAYNDTPRPDRARLR